MPGLIQVGQQYRDQSIAGLDTVNRLEHARDVTGQNLKQQDRSATMQAVGTGAGLGLMAGMQAGSVGGPMGMAIGAGIGLLASKLF